jgi:Uma2 family endonuclease
MTLTDRQLPPPPDFDKPLPVGLRMSEEEFVAWYTFEGQAEWVDGEVIFLSPAARPHDRLQWWLRSLLQLYVEHNKLGEVLGPQFVTRLSYGGKKVSRREPDLLFVSNVHLDRLKPTFVDGPPDLVMEVVSPESQNRDRRHKFNEYESAGVDEYWIVDPVGQYVEAYSRVDALLVPIPRAVDQIKSTVVSGWYLRPSWLWQEPRLDVRIALAELGLK